MLNRASGYCLLLLYLTVSFKPLLSIVQDTWEHAFNEAEHMATVHARSGNHHLQKEIAEHHTDDDHDKNDHSLKPEDEVPFHLLLGLFTIDFSIDNHTGDYPIPPLYRLRFVVLSCPSPPPKENIISV
jgi:hypothetical protein